MMYNPTFLGDIDLNEDTLAHYGVKGMKWRRRKGQLKGKGLELRAKVNRRLRGMSADQISYNSGKDTFDRHDDGKARSTSNAKGNRRYNGKLEIDNSGYSTNAHNRSGAGVSTAERSRKVQAEQATEMIRNAFKKKKK